MHLFCVGKRNCLGEQRVRVCVCVCKIYIYIRDPLFSNSVSSRSYTLQLPVVYNYPQFIHHLSLPLVRFSFHPRPLVESALLPGQFSSICYRGRNIHIIHQKKDGLTLTQKTKMRYQARLSTRLSHGFAVNVGPTQPSQIRSLEDYYKRWEDIPFTTKFQFFNLWRISFHRNVCHKSRNWFTA